jgi:hypothetical protein
MTERAGPRGLTWQEYCQERYDSCLDRYGAGSTVTQGYRRELDRMEAGEADQSVAGALEGRPVET